MLPSKMITKLHILRLINNSPCILLNTRSISSKPSKNHYDIIISGGGMVGTTLACALGKNAKLSNLKILLLEASPDKGWSISDKYSNRVVSVNPSTKTLFKSIGVWDFIEKHRFATVKRLQVWDALSKASITFGEVDSSSDVSYIVENDLIIAGAKEELKKINNVEVLYSSKVKSYHLPEYHENISALTLESGDKFTCDLLLGCDGVNSQVRKSMNVKYLSWNYNQLGVVATLKLSEKIKNEIAWQRFLPTGPIGLLPLTDELSSLVWSTTPEDAKRLLSLTDQEFVDCLNSSIWKNYNTPSVIDQATSAFDTVLRMMNCSVDSARQWPPKIAEIESGSRAAFPLGFGHATHYIGKGAALVGDAAHRIHPLAGQGVNLGFGDVTTLNQVLGDAVYSGSSINDLDRLKDYETERQRHNVPTMLAVDGLHRLYTTDFPPLVLLRSLGLQATDALGFVKKAIISQAST